MVRIEAPVGRLFVVFAFEPDPVLDLPADSLNGTEWIVDEPSEIALAIA